jgi:L-arabinokinase
MNPSYPIVFYVSGHGFGHASRIATVIHVLRERGLHVPIVVKTQATERLFDEPLRGGIEFVPLQCDTGIVQLDSLNLNERESVRQAAEFQSRIADRAAAEADDLRRRRAQLVVGDIPPLAFEAARAAGLPSIAIGNFTWDWIYGAYGHEGISALVQSIRESYRQATRVLRLPISGGFEGLDGLTRNIPFIARSSGHDPDDVRRHFRVPHDKPMVLMSFGGYGLQGLGTLALAKLDRYSIVAGGLKEATIETGSEVIQITEHQLMEKGYRYNDLVRAADIVITKPGYGIVTDCIANDTAIVYTSRGRFAEYDLFVEEMPRYVRTQFIDQKKLLAGDWSEALERVLAQPIPNKPAINGADIVADTIQSLGA